MYWFPTIRLSMLLSFVVCLTVSVDRFDHDGAWADPPQTPEKPPGEQSGDSQASKISTAKESQSDVQSGPRALSRAFRTAARKATPSVVTILSYGQDARPGSHRSGGRMGPADPPQNPNPPLNPRGRQGSDEDDPSNSTAPDQSKLTGLGSGVIVSRDGRIITNNHVIAGAKRVVVQLWDETELEASNVFGDSASDVATLKISRDKPFQNVEIGDSDALEIGDWVLAIGSPFRLEATVSAGIISAKDRALRRINRGRLIQTDAAINPGNSGGPLIDLDGRVVAINTAIATRNGGYQGIGFAIPINHAKWIAEELSKHGKVRRAAIGIRMAELNPKIAAKFKLPVGMGILAYQVIDNSAADRAGIKPLDVILEFAGERVTDPASLQSIVERKPVGSFQEVRIYRAGEESVLQIEIASLEDPTLTTQTASESSQTDESESPPPNSPDDKDSKSTETQQESESESVTTSEQETSDATAP